MAEPQLASLMSRFQGCLIGALVGDCFGRPFEFSRSGLDFVKRFVTKVETKESKKDAKILYFTDDTEMRLSIEASLIKHKAFNAKDLAERFAKEYYASKIHRSYGAHITKIFSDWSSKRLDDIFLPATKQFNGSGSYGNGGGMRIAPVAMFLYKEQDPKVLKELSDKVTKLTHTHNLGILGAYLQARAVHFALNTTEIPFPTEKFLDELIETMTYYEEEAFGKSPALPHPEKPDQCLPLYSQKLKLIKVFLEQPDVDRMEVIFKLGNNVTALGSIPTAIYSFLRALSDIRGLEDRNPYERTIIYAISLGGDTDTIATMAGAIAGAYWGEELIPKVWQQSCEGLTASQKHATSLYKYVKK